MTGILSSDVVDRSKNIQLQRKQDGVLHVIILHKNTKIGFKKFLRAIHTENRNFSIHNALIIVKKKS